MRKKVLSFVLIAVLASVAYWGYSQINARKKAEETVRGYNNALIQALRRPEPELMKRWTGAKENERVTMYILYLYGNNHKLDAKLTSMKITGITREKDTTTVTTDELWSDQYLDAKTGQTVGEKENYHYQGTYKLVKDSGGNLVVDELEIKEIKD